MLGNVSCDRPGAVGSIVLWNVLTLTLRLFTLRVDNTDDHVPMTPL